MTSTATRQAQVSTRPVWRERLSLFSRGVRHKFLAASCLMAAIPLLVLLYVSVTYVLPHADFRWAIVAILALSAVVAWLGYVVARDMIAPIARIASQAKQLAMGNQPERDLPTDRLDELGDLGESMNRLNQRIRTHVGQLKDYGEQVRQLNVDIHKRVLAFSSLLQVSSLISQGVALDEILNCVMEKLSQIEEADLYAMLVPTGEADQLELVVAHGANPQQVSLLKGATLTSAWLTHLAREGQLPAAIDQRHRVPHEIKELQRLFGLTNALIMPVVSRGRCRALVVIGNRRPQFVFSDEVVETTKVFAKQIAIAIENDALSKRSLALAVTDEVTGLYNERYLRVRLEEEVKRALMYHQPCSFVLLDLDDFSTVHRERGSLAIEQILKQIAQLMLGHVSAVDKVARIRGNEFGMILPQRTKREAIEVAETLRQQIATTMFALEHDTLPQRLTISGGVSENPLDGETAEVLLEKARAALRLAKSQGKNRIVAS